MNFSKISLFCLSAAALAGTAAPQAFANEPYFPRGEKAFQRLDANKDGRISTAEFAPVMDKRVATMDANGDKVLTAAEIDAALIKRVERRRVRIMQLLDANKDGSITEAELDGVVEDMFDKADADHNGGVDMVELRSFKRAKWRKALIDGQQPATDNKNPGNKN
jgi:Ca2+-binding EF-hand superfamily protein